MFFLSSTFSKLKFLCFLVCKIEVWTCLGFEYDSVACKNSFNSSLYLLWSSDNVSWSNLIWMQTICPLFARYWVTKKWVRVKFNKFNKKKQSSELNEFRGAQLILFLIPSNKRIVLNTIYWVLMVKQWVKHVRTFQNIFIDWLGCRLQQRKPKKWPLTIFSTLTKQCIYLPFFRLAVILT